MENTVNERIKVLRKHLNMSQREFASKIGTTFGTISRIEKIGSEPQFTTLNKIIEEFSLNREWLVDGIGEMYKDRESIKVVEVNTWKEEAFDSLKDQVNHLKTEIEWLRDMLKLSMGGKQTSANFNYGAGASGFLSQKLTSSVRAQA